MPREIKLEDLNTAEIKQLLVSLEDFKIDFKDVLLLAICYRRNYSIAELQEKLNLAYKNFMPHLKRLQKYDFVTIEDKGRGFKKSVTTNLNNTDVAAFLNLAGIPRLLRR